MLQEPELQLDASEYQQENEKSLVLTHAQNPQLLICRGRLQTAYNSGGEEGFRNTTLLEKVVLSIADG